MALDGNGKLLEEQTAGGRPFVFGEKNINAQRSTPAGKAAHASVQATASPTEASSTFDVDFICFIFNDGDYDITFNLDAGTTAAGAFTLKPGDALNDFPRNASKIYYKSIGGSSAFRALGVK